MNKSSKGLHLHFTHPKSNGANLKNNSLRKRPEIYPPLPPGPPPSGPPSLFPEPGYEYYPASINPVDNLQKVPIHSSELGDSN